MSTQIRSDCSFVGFRDKDLNQNSHRENMFHNSVQAYIIQSVEYDLPNELNDIKVQSLDSLG